MRKQLILSLLFLLILATACKNGDSSPKSTPGEPKEPATAPNALALPPVDRTCATDEDCTFAPQPTLEDGVCCHGCPSVPASRAFRQQVVRLCNEHNANRQVSGCPKLNCSDVPDVACVQGECRVRK